MNRRFPIMLFGGNAGDATGAGGGGGTGSEGATSGGAGAGGATPPTFWSTHLQGDFAPLASSKSLESIKGETWEEVGPQLAKGYVNAQGLIGDAIHKPKPGSDGKIKPEDQRAFWTKIGVPETIEGYKDVKLPSVEGLGAMDPKMVDAAKPEFLKLGYNAEQLQGALNIYAKVTAQQRKALADQWLGEQAALEEKWGALNFDANVEAAKRVLNRFFPKNFLTLLGQSQLDMHSGMMEGLYEISKLLSEGRFIEGSEPTVEDNKRLEDQIKELRDKRSKMNMGQQGYKEISQQIDDLYKRRYGTAEVVPAVQVGR